MKLRGLTIQLQNHGCRNNPFWWIVAMNKRENLYGNFKYHLGFIFHKKNKGHDRQIILNKKLAIRLFAQGAHLTRPVQRILSYFGICPGPFYINNEQKTKLKGNKDVLDEKAKKRLQGKMMQSKRMLANRELGRPKLYRDYMYQHNFKEYQYLNHRIQEIGIQNQEIKKILMAQNIREFKLIDGLKGEDTEIIRQPHLAKKRLQELRGRLSYLKSLNVFNPVIHEDLLKSINELSPFVFRMNLFQQIQPNQSLGRQLIRTKVKEMFIKLNAQAASFSKRQKLVSKEEAIQLINASKSQITESLSLTTEEKKSVIEAAFQNQNLFVTQYDLIQESKRIISKKTFDLYRRQKRRKLKSIYRKRRKYVPKLITYDHMARSVFLSGETVYIQPRNTVNPRPDYHTHVPAQHFDVMRGSPKGRFNKVFVPSNLKNIYLEK